MITKLSDPVRPLFCLPLQPVDLENSHSAFAIVADSFDRTSCHGFLAKRFLLRGGRLLKYIGVATIVATREISGCGFPAKVAVPFSFMQTEIRLERVSRHRAVLDPWTSKAALIQPRLLTPAASLRRETNRQACFISRSAERPIVRRLVKLYEFRSHHFSACQMTSFSFSSEPSVG